MTFHPIRVVNGRMLLGSGLQNSIFAGSGLITNSGSIAQNDLQLAIVPPRKMNSVSLTPSASFVRSFRQSPQGRPLPVGR
jgi:hypothetical protein